MTKESFFFLLYLSQTSCSCITKSPWTFKAAEAANSGGQLTGDRWQVTLDTIHITCDKRQMTHNKIHIMHDRWEIFLVSVLLCRHIMRFSASHMPNVLFIFYVISLCKLLSFYSGKQICWSNRKLILGCSNNNSCCLLTMQE